MALLSVLSVTFQTCSTCYVECAVKGRHEFHFLAVRDFQVLGLKVEVGKDIWLLLLSSKRQCKVSQVKCYELAQPFFA